MSSTRNLGVDSINVYLGNNFERWQFIPVPYNMLKSNKKGAWAKDGFRRPP